MERKRITEVVLEVSGTTKSFPLKQAEKIMRMKLNGGWELPEHSPYKFDKENGFRINRSTEEAKKLKQKGDNK